MSDLATRMTAALGQYLVDHASDASGQLMAMIPAVALIVSAVVRGAWGVALLERLRPKPEPKRQRRKGGDQ